jgi:hypothetical protein
MFRSTLRIWEDVANDYASAIMTSQLQDKFRMQDKQQYPRWASKDAKQKKPKHTEQGSQQHAIAIFSKTGAD